MAARLQWSGADRDFMCRALALAAKGRGRTSPNPLVGAVVVQDGEVVGEGYHQKAGEAHAEVHALNRAGDLAQGGTLYVTLEPCSHWGRTPPCTEAVIRAGITAVFVAMEDPNPRVAGSGIRQLEESGVHVQVGLCEKKAQRLNEIYIKYITTEQPFVILKAAISLDGKIATASGESQWITSEASRLKAHEIRDQVDAVLVGIRTVLRDDPSLTTRLPGQRGKDPIRVIVDSHCRTPLASKVLHTNCEAATLIAVTERAPQSNIERLKAAGADVLMIEEREDHVCLETLMRELGRREITSVLIEGGGEVNASALKVGIVDKVMFFIAPKLIGGKEAPGAIGGEGIGRLSEAFALADVEITHINGDFLVEGYLKRQT